MKNLRKWGKNHDTKSFLISFELKKKYSIIILSFKNLLKNFSSQISGFPEYNLFPVWHQQ